VYLRCRSFSQATATGKRNAHVPDGRLRRAHHVHATADAQAGQSITAADRGRQEEHGGRGVALGADPATMYSGDLRASGISNEMMMRDSWWANGEMVSVKHSEIEVPANAECVDGYLDSASPALKGQFGDHKASNLGETIPRFFKSLHTAAQDPIYATDAIVGRRPWQTFPWEGNEKAFFCS